MPLMFPHLYQLRLFLCHIRCVVLSCAYQALPCLPCIQCNRMLKYNIAMCPGFRDKQLMGCGLDEAAFLDDLFTITFTVTTVTLT
jgi:hypothetical protein